MAVKKTATAKRKTTVAKNRTAPPKKKATTKSGPPKGRSTTAKGKTTAAKKSTTKTTTAKNVKEVKKPAGKRGGFHREINDETGFVVGTDQDKIALALLEGGKSRADIVEKLNKKISTETRNGTEKQITNMVSGVLNKMLDRGFTTEQTFLVLPPTPASKRAASRRRNAAKK